MTTLVTEYGKERIKKWRVSPDGVIQVVDSLLISTINNSSHVLNFKYVNYLLTYISVYLCCVLHLSSYTFKQ